MQNENNIFEGIPGLGDAEAFQDYVNNQNAQEIAGNPATPSALQPNNPAPSQEQTQYTAEDIQRIIAENNQYKAQLQAQAQAQAQAKQASAQPAAQAQQMYAQAMAQAQRQQAQRQVNPIQVNPQLQAAVARALAQGYTPEQIYAAMQGNTGQAKLENQVNQIQQYLQQQQYQREESAFIEKMTSFGNKWGLSEADLVTFANEALAKGINVAQVSDVEAVFRAVYPEQYAFRAQRMANQNNSSPLYGGTAFQEAPRAAQAKYEDAYVEAFLKGKMPNAYNKFNNLKK